MSLLSRVSSWTWLLLPCCAAGFLIWINLGRLDRVTSVSGLPGRAEPVDLVTADSATGYANGQRELILPDRNENSVQWIAQTQQMFAQREWRVRHVDYDNAPSGRDVSAASPYRWWLGLVAWFDHIFSGRPIGLSVERAAWWADPVLQGLLLFGGTIFVAVQFGRWAAAALALGLAVTFPLAAEFMPGMPDAHGLAVTVILASLLALLAGMSALRTEGGKAVQTKARRWFLAAGVLGGGTLWINVSLGVPVLLGIMFGAILAAIIVRRGQPQSAPVPPWRAWTLGGAAAVLGAYLAEYYPAHWGAWQLESIHPLYALAWLGAGELLHRVVAGIQRQGWALRARDAAAVILSVAAVAAIPVVMHKTESPGFLARDLYWLRLTHLPEGVTATSFWGWVIRDGANATVGAVLLPLGLVGSAIWLILVRRWEVGYRASLGLLLGPVAVALGFAWRELNWWSVLDATLLVLLVAMASSRPAGFARPSAWCWLVPAGLFMLPGLIQLWPTPPVAGPPVLTGTEAELLIERDLAHWLARHSHYERAVVYAPPDETTTLAFYGGLRGIGTFSRDNEVALEGTLKIASAGTPVEAQLLLQGREVRYLVVPSWDSFFEDYARLYQAKNGVRWEGSFLQALREWQLPPWLRPLPYAMPVIGGLDRQSVLVFEVVSDQSPAVAASRMVECLLDIGETERAGQAQGVLQQFSGDVGALAAAAQVKFALGDAAGFDDTVASLLKRLQGGGDRYLPWDRRVSLAIVLARAKRSDLARPQVQRCVTELTDRNASSLSTGSLYNLLGLARAFGLPVADPATRAWSLQLLPPEMRARVE